MKTVTWNKMTPNFNKVFSILWIKTSIHLSWKISYCLCLTLYHVHISLLPYQFLTIPTLFYLSWLSSGAIEHGQESQNCFDWLYARSVLLYDRYYDRKVKELAIGTDMAIVKYTHDKVLNREVINELRVTGQFGPKYLHI